MKRAELRRLQKLPTDQFHAFINDMLAEQEKETRMQTLDYTIKCIYSLMCLSLHDNENFGKVRLTRLLNDIEDRFKVIPSADQLVKEVKERFDISIGGE